MKRTVLFPATALAAMLVLGGGLALAQQGEPRGPSARAEWGQQRQGQPRTEGRGPRAAQNGRATRQQEQRQAQQFGQIDADSDGRLSQAEVLDWREAVFYAMDADSDGTVSRAEYLAVRLGPGATDGAEGRQAAAMQARKTRAFDAMDAEGTGTVAFDAFMAGAAAMFAEADSDGDGYLDRLEGHGGAISR